ncbi:MAG: hypothetical protein ACREFK_12925 [Stellaceae bacterium]
MPSCPAARCRPLLLAALFACVLGLAAAPAHALNLLATHQVTVQFATRQGKPMAHARVSVFAPGDSNKPALTGYTDANGQFTFSADRNGFWSAAARSPGEVVRVMVRVGGGPALLRSRFAPLYVIGALLVLLVAVFWYRTLRARRSRP